MNIYLRDFTKEKFANPGRALDLGAGQFFDVACLRQLGWEAEGVDLATGTDLNLPYQSPAAPFDLVYSNYVIQKLADQHQLVATAHDNLKPGGWFFLLTFDAADPNSMSELTAEELKEVLAVQGFKGVQVRQIDFYDNEPRHQHWHKILEAVGRK